jgi:pimeloyl-ACP methyl ester carboxylesterase
VYILLFIGATRSLEVGMHPILGTIAALAGVVALSYLVEVLRREPLAPDRLDWAPGIPVRHVAVGGIRLRYLAAGDGPPLVLLHTMRTQLDLFQRVMSALTARHRVYAVDLPGHGWSDIPEADYTAPFFIDVARGFLEALDLRDVVLVGESIGATIALGLAARDHPRVRAVVAINAYDYDRGRGLQRSSPVARLILGLNDVPVIGDTVARLRQYPVVKHILDGGLYRERELPHPLAREIYRVGNRRGHARAFASLVHHWPTWEAERERYGAIQRPVLLIYGDHDWSRPDEREETARRIPRAASHTVPSAGHFLSFDAPEDVSAKILEFAEVAFRTP